MHMETVKSLAEDRTPFQVGRGHATRAEQPGLGLSRVPPPRLSPTRLLLLRGAADGNALTKAAYHVQRADSDIALRSRAGDPIGRAPSQQHRAEHGGGRVLESRAGSATGQQQGSWRDQPWVNRRKLITFHIDFVTV